MPLSSGPPPFHAARRARPPAPPHLAAVGPPRGAQSVGANWTILAFGNVFHGFTDPASNRPPSSRYSSAATRYGYALGYEFITDAFAGKL